jgi:hypothetical protein
MKNVARFLAPFALTLIPSACSLIADADRSKITDDDSGEGGSGDSPGTGGTSGKGGSAGAGKGGSAGTTTTGGTGGLGGGAGSSGTGGEPDVGGMGGEPGGMGGEPAVGGTGGDTGGDAGTGGVPDTAGMGGEAGMGGGCGLDICGELCVDTSVDAAHCGACDRACSNENTSALACASGQCTPTCATGFADCTTDDGEGDDDGCETNLNDVATCGTSCGNLEVCEANEFCVDGVCQAQCEAPNTECGEACVNLEERIDHCGECDRGCDTSNTTGTACTSGVCEPSCSDGFEDCNEDDGTGADDGCETDIAGSTENCNACDRACSTTNASVTACNSGACAPTCNAGFGDCAVDDGSGTDDGCETNLDDTVAHCNACNRACSTANATATDCSGGECDPTCSAGFTDCNQDDGTGPDDGCETNTAGSATNCNACGRTCSNANASATACSSGACAPTCNIGFGDCVVDTGSGDDNGCETNIASSTANCNACNRACSTANASVTACNSGSCDPTCDADFADCNVDDGSGTDDGCETEIAGDAANCNACGRTCSEAGASDASCFNGRCDPACTGSFEDCNVDDGSGPDDGCETDLAASATSCNACGRVCSNANASATACTTGACAPTCRPSFGDCNADDGNGPDDGCETNFDAPTTCGLACGALTACTSGETCIAGVCSSAATGVVKVLVPLAAAGQGQRYNILHQSANVNLAGANVTFRMYAPNAINGQLSIFFLGGADSPKTAVPFTTINAGFTDVVVAVPPAAGSFNPSAVSVIRIEVEVPSGQAGPWEQPATAVYIDSVTSDNLALNDTFNTNPIPSLFSNSGARPLAGSQEKYLSVAP